MAEAFHGFSSKYRHLLMFFIELAWWVLCLSKFYSFPLWQVGVEVGPWWETTESSSISWSGSAALFIMSTRTCWEAPFGHSSDRWGVSLSWAVGHLGSLHKNIMTHTGKLKGLKVPHIHSLWFQVWCTLVLLNPVKWKSWDGFPFQLTWPCHSTFYPSVNSVLPCIVFKLNPLYHFSYCTVLLVHTNLTVLSYYFCMHSALLIMPGLVSIFPLHRCILSSP